MKRSSGGDAYEIGQVPGELTPAEVPLSLEQLEAGFPAPNGGYIDRRLDVGAFLVHHPANTYMYGVRGESMRDAGILPGDCVLVDVSEPVRDGDIVVASLDGEFTVKIFRRGPPLRFEPCNPEFAEIVPDDYTRVEIIGPVVSVVRRYR